MKSDCFKVLVVKCLKCHSDGYITKLQQIKKKRKQKKQQQNANTHTQSLYYW